MYQNILLMRLHAPENKLLREKYNPMIWHVAHLKRVQDVLIGYKQRALLGITGHIFKVKFCIITT